MAAACTTHRSSVSPAGAPGLDAAITEGDGKTTVTLSNRDLTVRFGRVMLGSGEPEDAIVNFVPREAGEDQVDSHFDEGSVQTLSDAVLIHDGTDRKIVRLSWHGASKLQEATIYRDRPYIRLDYLVHPKWIVDIGAPGGITEGGAYAIYGSEKWRQGFVQYPEIYYDTREGDRPGPFSYKGWFIGGVYNPENGRGFGRAMPMQVIDVVKLLWGSGIEFLSFPGSGNRPFTGYLFAVTQGAEQVISRGKEIVDQAEDTLLGWTPLAGKEDIPFKHVVVDTSYGGIRGVGDVSGDGHPDIIHAYWYDEAPLAWYEYHAADNWTPHVIREDFYPQTDDFETADVDADGDMDVVIAHSDAVTILWLENPLPEGNPRTDAWKEHTIGVHSDPDENYIKDIEVVDVDEDGLIDVLTRAHVSLAVFRQSLERRWERLRYFKIPPHEGMDVGDLDVDGDPDVVLNGYWLETPEDPAQDEWTRHIISTRWYAQTGDWTANNAKVLVTDMSGDDRPDVLLAHSERPGYPVAWYEAEEPPTGPWIEHVIDTVDYCHTLQAADFDGDGDRDVLVGEMDKSDDPDHILVYRNDGAALSWNREVVETESIYSGVAADIDGDGDWDVVANRDWDMAPIELWLNLLQSPEQSPRATDDVDGTGR